MATTFGASGTVAYGSTSVAPTYPAGITAGDMLLLVVATKPASATINTPSGWSASADATATGTFGTNGVDAGPTKITVLIKVATGSESGSQSVSITSGNASWGVIYRISSTNGTFDGGTKGGEDTSSGTGFSVAVNMTSNPIPTGALVIALAAKPTDAGTWGSHTIAASGLTFGTITEIAEYLTTTGNDIGGAAWYGNVTAGTSASNPTVTVGATLSSASYGPAVVMSFFEVPSSNTGTLNASVPRATSSISGASVNSGSLNASVPRVTSAITEQVPNLGTLAGTLPVAAGSLSGASKNNGTLGASLPSVTGSISGIFTMPGSLSASTPLLVGSATGSATNSGTLSASTPIVAGSLPGSAKNDGSLAGSVPRVASSTTGQSINSGTMAGTLPVVVASTAGSSVNLGMLSASVPRVVANIAESNVNSGNLNASLPRVTGSAIGQSVNTGSLNASAPRATSSIMGTAKNSGSLSATLPLVWSNIPGSARNVGTLSGSLLAVTGDLTGDLVTQGILSGQLLIVTGDLIGEATNEGSLETSMPLLKSNILVSVRNFGVFFFSVPPHQLPLLRAQLTADLVIPGDLDSVLPMLESDIFDFRPTAFLGDVPVKFAIGDTPVLRLAIG